MENPRPKIPLGRWIAQIVVQWFIFLAVCEGIWLDWPRHSVVLFILVALVASIALRSTITFMRVMLLTIPVSIQEFPHDTSTELVCNFDAPPARGMLLVQLDIARKSEFSFELVGGDRSEIQKTIRQKTGKGAMGGSSRAYFTFGFDRLPSWTTGLRLRIKPVNPVPRSGKWIAGRVYLLAKKAGHSLASALPASH